MEQSKTPAAQGDLKSTTNGLVYVMGLSKSSADELRMQGHRASIRWTSFLFVWIIGIAYRSNIRSRKLRMTIIHGRVPAAVAILAIRHLAGGSIQ
ncbi:hypothetical protein GYMLUDRAFT_253557 [Collybiopsis luxurians FD-317 M1]|uniref:Uncharacterized protein n=1 Tax=Collybiopsis luxurians FD-317 M1 TaxID=944289 RepID=A0A0D0BW64_9AGAR|nr:hypothetical protein GYMLUDRAFT_253557 [Collybiopsis luxurians FD-317 M1]